MQAAGGLQYSFRCWSRQYVQQQGKGKSLPANECCTDVAVHRLRGGDPHPPERRSMAAIWSRRAAPDEFSQLRGP